MKLFIDNALQLGKDTYETHIKKGYKYAAIPLNCKDLPDNPESPGHMNPAFFGALHGMFDDNNEINKRTCLYIIEIVSPSVEKIERAYRDYLASGQARNSSAIKKNVDTSTSILYIGKVKKGLGGRIATHMGYANPRTGALQLVHWAKKIDLRLNVHVYAFESSLGNFINPLELTITKSLNPLIGKSK